MSSILVGVAGAHWGSFQKLLLLSGTVTFPAIGMET